MSNIKFTDVQEEVGKDTMDIDEKLEKIAELEKRLKELSPEDEQILQCIKDTLKEEDFQFVYDLEFPNRLSVAAGFDNMPFELQIAVCDRTILLHLDFPFVVQSNSLALVALEITEFNNGKTFGSLQLNQKTGALSMKDAFILGNPDEYDSSDFLKYMFSLIVPSMTIYTRLYRLAVGKVSPSVKEYYKVLLEKSLAVINGDEEDEREITYGADQIKKELAQKKTVNRMPCMEDYMKMFMEQKEDVSEDDTECANEKEDVALPFQ